MSPWLRVAAGLWVGSEGRPYRGEFDYVLTITNGAHPSDDGLRHKTLPAPESGPAAQDMLDHAVMWLKPRWQEDKKVLVTSPGWYWADAVIVALFVHLGATADEALTSLRLARPEAIPGQLLLDLLRAREVDCA